MPAIVIDSHHCRNILINVLVIFSKLKSKGVLGFLTVIFSSVYKIFQTCGSHLFKFVEL